LVKKVKVTLSQKKKKASKQTNKQQTSQACWHVSGIPATQQARGRSISSETSPGKSLRPYLKNKLKQKGLICSSSDTASA
jgi:hypothetical protein